MTRVDLELQQARAAYLEACLEWASHPCPGHLYNLELFKTQLADCFQKIKNAGRWSELLGNLHPAPVLHPDLIGDASDTSAVARVERYMRCALASTSAAVLILEGLNRLTPYAPSVQAFKGLFDALHKWRRWLLEQGVTYPRGFSPGCCQIRDSDDVVVKADILVEKYMAAGMG